MSIDKCFEQFQQTTPEFFQYFSEKAVRVMFLLAEERMEETGNPPSVSLFSHCFDDLKEAGLEKLRGPLPEPGSEPKDERNMDPDEFLRFYHSLKAREVTSKYRHNADFKRQVNRLIELAQI